MQVATDLSSYWSPNLHKHNSKNRLYRWHLNAFHECVHQLLSDADPGRVLDAGCGEGFVIDYLRKQNPSIQFTGVDTRAEAITYARSMLDDDVRLRVGSIYKLPFSDNSFDAVLCNEVLEHLDDPLRALDEMKRVTRRHVLISVPREPIFRLLNDLGQVLGLSPDPGHVNFWTRRSFEHLINKHFDDATFVTKHVFQLALAEA